MIDEIRAAHVDSASRRVFHPPHPREPIMRRTISAAFLLAPLLFMTNCASTPVPPQECPTGAQAAVIWSSERSTTSTVQFVAADSILESRSIDVAGVSPSTPIVEDGGKVYALATGSVTADRSSVVEVDQSSCSTRVIPVSGPAYAFDVHDGTITLATAFTDRSEVRRFNLAGQDLGSTTIPEVAIGTLLDAGETIHAFAADAMGETVDYLSLDPLTLAVREQRTVDGVV